MCVVKTTPTVIRHRTCYKNHVRSMTMVTRFELRIRDQIDTSVSLISKTGIPPPPRNAGTLNWKNLLTDSRSNKYSSKIEDTRHIHTTYILLQIKYNNIYCTKREVHSHTQL